MFQLNSISKKDFNRKKKKKFQNYLQKIIQSTFLFTKNYFLFDLKKLFLFIHQFFFFLLYSNL